MPWLRLNSRRIHEKIGAHTEAARWYTARAERFRRGMETKAEEALTRLGAPIPVAPAAASASEPSASPQLD